MLKLYSHPSSPYGLRVQLCLEKLDRGFEITDVSLNPLLTGDVSPIIKLGKVPRLVDGNFSLAESSAILRYLCFTTPRQTLYAEDYQQRAIIDMWSDFTHNHIGLAASQLAWEKIWKRVYGLKEDVSTSNQATKRIEKNMPVVEKQLKQHQYLASNEESLADISFYPQAHCLELLNFDFSSFPLTQSWILRVRGGFKNAFLKI